MPVQKILFSFKLIGSVLAAIAAAWGIFEYWKNTQPIVPPITFDRVSIHQLTNNSAQVQTWFYRTNPVCHFTSWSPVVIDSASIRWEVQHSMGGSRTVDGQELLTDTYYIYWSEKITPGEAVYQASINYVCENKVTVVDYPEGLYFNIERLDERR